MGSVNGSVKFETFGKRYEFLGPAESHDEAMSACDQQGMHLMPLDIGSATYDDEMTEIGRTLAHLTQIRWGLRLWLPYQLVDGAWISDYSGKSHNAAGLPWSYCSQDIVPGHTSQPTGPNNEKCLQYRIDLIKYGTDEQCIWDLYNDNCHVPGKQNRYVLCSDDYSAANVLSGNLTTSLFYKF